MSKDNWVVLPIRCPFFFFFQALGKPIVCGFDVLKYHTGTVKGQKHTYKNKKTNSTVSHR